MSKDYEKLLGDMQASADLALKVVKDGLQGFDEQIKNPALSPRDVAFFARLKGEYEAELRNLDLNDSSDGSNATANLMNIMNKASGYLKKINNGVSNTK